MIVKKSKFDSVKVIESNPYIDDRGYFRRLYCNNSLSKSFQNIAQVNHSFNLKKGTVRGMHYQIGDFAEKKLVTCVSGKIIDVIIDINKDSKTYLQHFSQIIGGEMFESILVPEGFAHGFQVLEDNTSLIYFHDKPHNPNFERRLNPLDPKIMINWPLDITLISEKDATAPLV